MNSFVGTAAGVNTQPITRARFLLLFVDQSIQAVLDRSQGATVVIPETLILAWSTLLTTAVDQLSAIPAPLINPPPRWVTLIQTATALINNALQLLAGIPIARPLIFPPRPGAATVQVQLLQQIQANVRLAAQTLEAAERDLTTR